MMILCSFKILEWKVLEQWTWVWMMNLGSLYCMVFYSRLKENWNMFLGSFFTTMFDKVCRILLLMLGMNRIGSMVVLHMIKSMGKK
jgi:hypothetical protein